MESKSTYTIDASGLSLPIEGFRKYGLTQGDEVTIVQTEQGLIVLPRVTAAAAALDSLGVTLLADLYNPSEMLWRHFRRQVTHCELFVSVTALLQTAHDFFDHYNRCPDKVLSIIGSRAT